MIKNTIKSLLKVKSTLKPISRSQNIIPTTFLNKRPNYTFFWVKNNSFEEKLGVNEKNTIDEIKQAYSIKVHKTKSSGLRREKLQSELQSLRECYEELMTLKQKKAQDEPQNTGNPGQSLNNEQKQNAQQFEQEQQQQEKQQEEQRRGFNKFTQHNQENWNNPESPGSKKALGEFMVFSVVGTIVICAVFGFAIKDHSPRQEGYNGHIGQPQQPTYQNQLQNQRNNQGQTYYLNTAPPQQNQQQSQQGYNNNMQQANQSEFVVIQDNEQKIGYDQQDWHYQRKDN